MKRRRRRPLFALIALIALASFACARSPEERKQRHLERAAQYVEKNELREAIIEYRNVLRIDANDAPTTRRLGVAHLSLGEVMEAFPHLKRAVELDPNDMEARFKLAGVYVAGKKLDEARAEVDAVLEKDPKNVDALALHAATADTPEKAEQSLKKLEAVQKELGDQPKFRMSVAIALMRRGDFEAAERELKQAVGLAPDAAESHTLLAGFYVDRQRWEEAEKEFEEADRVSPIGSIARVNLVAFYVRTNKLDRARELLAETTKNAPEFGPAWRQAAELAYLEKRFDDAEAALQHVPRDLPTLLLRAKIHLARGQAPEARDLLLAVIKTEPRYADAHYELARVRIAEGNAQQAKTHVSTALAVNPNHVGAKLLLAKLNLQSGAFQPAIEALEGLTQEQPGNAESLSLLGAALLASKEPDRALATFDKLRQVAPDLPVGFLLRGIALRAQGKEREALAEFEAALKIAPGNAEALKQIVDPQIAAKDVDGALDRVRKQVELAPKSGPMRHLLGLVSHQRGDSKAAEKAFLEAIELEPSLFDPYLSLGRLYALDRRFDEAVLKLEAAAKLNPKAPGLPMAIGVMHQLDGDLPRAREAYEKALLLDPRFGPAANNLAYVFTEAGEEPERALELAQVAKEQMPDDPRISDTLGWILYKRGVYEKALRLLNESATKLTGDPEVHFHLGMTNYKLGNAPEAKKALSRSLELSTTFAGADEAKRVLDELG